LSSGATRPPTGVLLVNLGSPEAPTPEALRAYLGEFLSDPRVVPLPGWIWQPVLRALVLPLRSPRSAELYRRVWTPEGPPLLAIGQRQAAALGTRLGPGFVVRLAMRYGRPSVFDGLHALRAAGCAPIVLLPLFPQEAEATTGSVRAAARLAAAAQQRSATACTYSGSTGKLSTSSSLTPGARRAKAARTAARTEPLVASANCGKSGSSTTLVQPAASSASRPSSSDGRP